MIQEALNLYRHFQGAGVKNSIAASNLTIACALLRKEKSSQATLTVSEVAERLNVCEKTVRKLLKAGDMSHTWVGNQIRIPLDDFEQYLKRSPKRSISHHHLGLA